MKRKTVIVGLAIALTLCGICAAILLNGNRVDEGKSGGVEDGGNISAILGDNRELLLKYVDTPSNLAVSLLGLDGIVNDIRKSAQTGVDLTDECAELLKATTDVSREYADAFSNFNVRFLSCNEKTLEVKQTLDIDSFESALRDVLSAILEYTELLEDYKAEIGG